MLAAEHLRAARRCRYRGRQQAKQCGTACTWGRADDAQRVHRMAPCPSISAVPVGIDIDERRAASRSSGAVPRRAAGHRQQHSSAQGHAANTCQVGPTALVSEPVAWGWVVAGRRARLQRCRRRKLPITVPSSTRPRRAGECTAAPSRRSVDQSEQSWPGHRSRRLGGEERAGTAAGRPPQAPRVRRCGHGWTPIFSGDTSIT